MASVFAVTASAAAGDGKVMEELSKLKIDGLPFFESMYPVNSQDDNMYVLTAVEIGYRTSSASPGFAFFVYIYNPSCKTVVDDPSNAIQIGLNDSCEDYIYLGLKLDGFSRDNRFLKFKVVTTDTYGSVTQMYSSQRTDAERIYNIASLRLLAEGTVKTFPIKRAFCFSGYDSDSSLTCQFKELYALDAKIRFTNWISPNAGAKTDGSPATIYDHYEINSAYFTLPKSLFKAYNTDGYDFIQSIRAAYNAYKLTPIIVTRPDIFDLTTIDAIKSGTVVGDNGSNIDVMDLLAKPAYWWTTGGYDPGWIYTESSWLASDLNVGDADRYDCLAYYFENPLIPKDFDFEYGKNSMVAVSAEELETYFLERYNNSSYENSKLYSYEEYCLIDYNSADYGKDYLYNMSTYQMSVDLNKWYYKRNLKTDSYVYEDFNVTAKKIEVITEPSAYSSLTSDRYEAVAEDLYLGYNDVGDFSKLCASAAANDEVVVLLRFGWSDYTCTPVYDVPEVAAVIFGDPVAMAIEKWAYMDVNLVHVVFSKNGQAITVPIVSNTSNSFGDIVIFEDPVKDNPFTDDGGGDDNGLPEWLKNALRVIFIVIAFVLIILFVVLVFPILKPIFGIAGDDLSSAREEAKRRRKLKNEGKRKKKK